MNITTQKAALITLWFSALVVAGVILPVTTATGWTMVLAFGALPVMFFLLASRDPRKSMAQRIAAQTRIGRGW